MVVLINQTIRKANKGHRCNWCHGIIQKGEEYEYSTHKNDGEIYTWKNHLKCHELVDGINMWDYADDGLSDDNFGEALQEYLWDNNWFKDDDFSKDDFANKQDKLKDWFEDNPRWSDWVDKAYEIMEVKNNV